MFQDENIHSVYKILLENDENFKKFVTENKDKSINEIAKKYNLNWLIKR